MPSGPSRSGSALSGSPLPPATPPRPSTLPGGPLPPGPGRGDSLMPDRDSLRDRDTVRSTGTIDPDEPTEGIRLMP